MRELATGQLASCPLSPAQINALSDRPRSKVRRVADVWANDPLCTDHPWPEGWFLQRAFRQSNQDPTGRFARLFAQYLRVRSLLFRHLVDEPEARGLERFATTYDALRDYRAGLDAVFPEIASKEAPLHMGALEVRTGPPGGPQEIQQLARDLRDAQREHRKRHGTALEVGWVFHIIRDTKRDKPFKTQAHAVRRKLRPLLAALEANPGLLHLIRGLDIAGRETAGPLWLALPALHNAIRVSRRIAARSHAPPLQLSLHAGEDFRHLASGLRAIDEPIHWRILSRGDRLGHALALGHDARAWVAENGRVHVPRWTRLLDLLWMIDRVRSATRSPLRERVIDLPYLENQLAPILASLRWRAPLDEACNIWRTLGRPDRVARLLADNDPVGKAETMVKARLFGPRAGVFEEPIEVQTGPERDLLIALRADIARRVAERHIVIELNPSSNLSVAGLAHPVGQPHYHLLPWTQSDAPRPIVTLSADDPLQFTTCLADEYAYA